MSSPIDALSVFCQHSTEQTISANTWLFYQDDPIQDIYLLEKGLVKMSRIAASGDEVIGELRFRGTLLGAASALAATLAPMSAYTITECKVVRMSAQSFLQLVQNETIFAHELLILISQLKSEQSIRFTRHATFSAHAQLAQLLLMLHREFGTVRNGELCLASPLSKQDMAGWLGIAPQHLSVLLREMKSSGLIAEEKGWIIIRDYKRLSYEAETGVKGKSFPRLSGGQKSEL